MIILFNPENSLIYLQHKLVFQLHAHLYMNYLLKLSVFHNANICYHLNDGFYPFTPYVLSIILLSECLTVLMMVVQRILY